MAPFCSSFQAYLCQDCTETVTALQVPNFVPLFLVELHEAQVILFLQAVEIALKDSPAYHLIMTAGPQ